MRWWCIVWSCLWFLPTPPTPMSSTFSGNNCIAVSVFKYEVCRYSKLRWDWRKCVGNSLKKGSKELYSRGYRPDFKILTKCCGMILRGLWNQDTPAILMNWNKMYKSPQHPTSPKKTAKMRIHVILNVYGIICNRIIFLLWLLLPVWVFSNHLEYFKQERLVAESFGNTFLVDPEFCSSDGFTLRDLGQVEFKLFMMSSLWR